MSSEATQLRRDFWTRYAELYPDDGVPSGYGRNSVWRPVEPAGVNISLALATWGVWVGLRGQKGESPDAVSSRAEPLKAAFRQAISDVFDGRADFEPGTEWRDLPDGCDARREFETDDPDNWPHMAAWLHYMLHIYLKVIESAPVAQG